MTDRQKTLALMRGLKHIQRQYPGILELADRLDRSARRVLQKEGTARVKSLKSPDGSSWTARACYQVLQRTTAIRNAVAARNAQTAAEEAFYLGRLSVQIRAMRDDAVEKMQIAERFRAGGQQRRQQSIKVRPELQKSLGQEYRRMMKAGTKSEEAVKKISDAVGVSTRTVYRYVNPAH